MSGPALQPQAAYEAFLDAKTQGGADSGFEPVWMPSFLFDFQAAMVEWAVRKGRAAIFADCGLGKTPMGLTWASNVERKTRRPVLYLTPLAVGPQTIREAEKFDIDARLSRDGSSAGRIVVSNYERLTFRRKGDNPVPVKHPTGMLDYAGERKMPADLLPYRGWTGKQTENRYSHWIWRQYADCMWDDIRMNRTLPFREARDSEDEKHVHPLQLDVIDRCVELFSNPGENVFTPFMGVGSEVYSPILLGRRGIGAELKPSYYRQAVKNVQMAAAGRKDIETSEAFDFEQDAEAA